MVRGLAWQSILDRLDDLGIVYTKIAHKHTVKMHEHDFTVFGLKWKVKLSYQQWRVTDFDASQFDEPE